MPIYRRLPKRGFASRNSKTGIGYVNLITLQRLCDANIFVAGQDINADVLKSASVVGAKVDCVRLLAKGELKVALNISVGYASEAAVKAVEAVGGKVLIV
jgi:large subunit ribosomal protein L15